MTAAPRMSREDYIRRLDEAGTNSREIAIAQGDWMASLVAGVQLDYLSMRELLSEATQRWERLEALVGGHDQRLENVAGLMAQSVEDRAEMRRMIEALSARLAELEGELRTHIATREVGDAP